MDWTWLHSVAEFLGWLVGGFIDWLISDIVPLAPLVAAIGIVLAWMTYRQKTANDRDEQNWKRIEWSIDRALSDDGQTRSVGLRSMALMLSDLGVGGRDADILSECVHAVAGEDLGPWRSGAPQSSDSETINADLAKRAADGDNEGKAAGPEVDFHADDRP